MWPEFLVLTPTVLLVSAVAVGHRPQFRKARLNWRILSVSGLFLAAFGLVWVLRGWEQTAGPYRIGAVYPFGTHLQTWQVTFGFTWLGFGVLFFGGSLRAAAHPTYLTWLTLLLAWLVCMLPHGIIGAAMAVGGQDVTEAVNVAARVDAGEGLVLLLATAVAGLLFLASSAIGFVWTWWELRQGER